MAGRLEGLTALVTGGASGIGRAVVAAYRAEGAQVAVLDLRAAPEPDPEVLWVRGDVRRLADNARAVGETLERFGALDVLVANSGITDAFTPLAELAEDVVEDAVDELLAVNVKGYLLSARAALQPLVARGGSMIFTLSNAAFDPGGGGPLYTASKHAGLGIVRQLAFELAPRVRVNGVAPGGTPTDLRMPRALGLGEDAEARRAHDVPDLDRFIEEVTPLRISARPEDHAAAYVFLASPAEARTTTGAVIRTDAGLGVRGIGRVRGGDALLEAAR